MTIAAHAPRYEGVQRRTQRVGRLLVERATYSTMPAAGGLPSADLRTGGPELPRGTHALV